MMKLMQILIAIFMFIGGLQVAGAQPTSVSEAASDSIPLMNFHQFDEGLYRGARPSAAGMEYLQRIGVRTVIDLQGGDINDEILRSTLSQMEPGETPQWRAYENSTLESLHISFMNFPLSSYTDVTRDEKKVIGKILLVMSQPGTHPLYIHCEHGEDRTGLVVALYHVFYQNWTPEEAHEDMEAMGHRGKGKVLTHEMDEFFWQATRKRKNLPYTYWDNVFKYPNAE